MSVWKIRRIKDGKWFARPWPNKFATKGGRIYGRRGTAEAHIKDHNLKDCVVVEFEMVEV